MIFNKPNVDPFEVLTEAARTKQPGYRNSKEMHEDFRGLFLGSERGKRVFHQIMAWGGQYRSSVVPGDPYGTHVREGERSLAARILAAMVYAREEPPVKTINRSKE